MSDSVQPQRQQPTRLLCPWDSPGKNTGVGCHFLLPCMKVKSESEVAQSCPTLSDPMGCSLPGSSIHGIFQARVLEWGAIAWGLWKLLFCGLSLLMFRSLLSPHLMRVLSPDLSKGDPFPPLTVYSFTSAHLVDILICLLPVCCILSNTPTSKMSAG